MSKITKTIYNMELLRDVVINYNSPLSYVGTLLDNTFVFSYISQPRQFKAICIIL